MNIAFGIEEAANEASAFKSLLLATIEAAFNSDYDAEEYEDAFNYLYGMAYKQAENLKTLENEAFKILREKGGSKQ